MELRAARAAPSRRVSAYTTTVSMAGLTLLVLAAPAAARVAGRDPEPVLLLAALVLAAELMPLELGRPGGPGGVRAGDSTTMSQPFAFALVLGWGTPAGVVALGACSALADLLAGKAARKVLFNSAQLAIALGAAGLAYSLAGGHPGSPGDHPGGPPDPSRSTGGPPRRSPGPPLARPCVAARLRGRRACLLRGQQPAGGGGAGAGGGTPALGRVRQGVGVRA